MNLVETKTQIQGVKIVALPERVKTHRIPQVIDPQLKKLLGELDITNAGLEFQGTATADEIRYFFKEALAVSKPDEMTNHQLFMLILVNQFSDKELVEPFTTTRLFEKFFATDKDGNRVVNCFGYRKNFQAYEDADQAELGKFKYRIHLYQEWMGTWSKKHNTRTWLGFLSSTQRVVKTKTESFKFYIQTIWGSEEFLKVLSETYQSKKSYRTALVEKAKELEIVR